MTRTISTSIGAVACAALLFGTAFARQGTNQGDPQNGNGGAFGSSGSAPSRLERQQVPIRGTEELLPEGKSLQMLGDRMVRTIRSRNNDITISGKGNKIRITGKAKSVTVSGDGNKLTIDSAEGVEIEGKENLVVVATTKKVTAAGSDNKVMVGKGPRPTVKDAGMRNRIALPR